MSTKEKEERGIVKKIDSLGRITIPKVWRQFYGLDNGANVKVYMIDDETLGIKLDNK